MRLTDLKGTSWGRIAGIVVMVIGALILFAPIFFGGWIIGLIGIALVAAGFFQIIQLIRSDAPVESFFEYVPGALTLILGIVLFLSPNLLVSGLLLGVTLYLVTDGGFKVYNAFKHTGHERRWNLFNGIFGIILGIVFWRLLTANLGIVAIGVAVGLKLVVDGWQMVFHTELTVKGTELKYDPREHPDRLLGLEPNDAIGEMQTKLVRSEKAQVAQNVYWCLTMLVIFFAIHVLRTDAKWSYIGLISPFSAVVGDMVVALILGIVLILPIRLFLRKVSRPVERAAWRRFLHLDQAGAEPAIPEKLLTHWIEWRMRFSLEMKKIRSSINFAFWWLLRAGLPLTAVLIAVNSIWGFSWYFNSENWASGVWQRITSVRVDKWRASMTEDVEQNALAGGVAPDKVFAIEPEGITGTDDFSFVVIGDTGEGDPSQMVLRDQLIAAGKRDQVKFLLLSSDVIYPDGKMKDYERNFYLPFKGFDKPIYAIPGNHDWFDANEGFNANFLDADSAKLALRARLIRDVKTDLITTDQRFSEIVAEAARLRQYYGIKNGLQRGPYFDFHTPGFSLIAVDTGILRTLDERQKAWFEAALARSGNNFKMVILGHPFYVAGSEADTGDAEFSWIHETLRKYGVEVAMAGDTHDFEFYRERYSHEGKDREMLNFVNGGGGAYLSIGTAIAFPEKPATQDYAFYPRTDELMAKIDRETPVWKAPFLIWLRRFGGFPFDSEMVSGAFDFNYAPFFQSFVEVNVERSKGRVRLQLYGANGPLRWRDIQIGGSVKPQDRSDDDPVEFIAPLRPAQ